MVPKVKKTTFRALEQLFAVFFRTFERVQFLLYSYCPKEYRTYCSGLKLVFKYCSLLKLNLWIFLKELNTTPAQY